MTITRKLPLHVGCITFASTFTNCTDITTGLRREMIRFFFRLFQLKRSNRRNVGLFALAAAVVIFISYSKNSDHKRGPAAKDTYELLDSSQFRVRFDVSKTYAITEFSIVGANWKSSRNRSPCLATQGSVNYLHHLLPMCRRWQGLVSVAVLVPDVDFHLTVSLIENMKRCHPDVMVNMSFHFVYPVDYPPVVSSDDPLLDINDCSDDNLDVTSRTHFNLTKILYPQNLLRNVASYTCHTEHVLVSDIDMIPSLGMAPQLGVFLANASHCEKCAYVIPAYEVNENASVPNNKAELLDMVRQNQSRPYRQVAFALNQGATNAARWQELPDGDTVAIGYRLPCFKFHYEPFYLTGELVPPFDERFVGYGFTRNTQVYETQMTGFRFFVLNNVFLVQHEMVDDPFASPGRKKQVKANEKLYYSLTLEYLWKYKTVRRRPCASSD